MKTINKYLLTISVIFIFLGCENSLGGEFSENDKLVSNKFNFLNDTIIFFSDKIEYSNHNGQQYMIGGYSFPNYQTISETGIIKVKIKKVLGSNIESEFGIRYDGDTFNKTINFFIRMDGTFCIY